MRPSTIFPKYIPKNNVFLRRYQYYSNGRFLFPFLHKHLFCTTIDTSTTIKEVSLDDLLSSALLNDPPPTESDVHKTRQKPSQKQPMESVVIEQNNDDINDDLDDALDDDDDDPEIDSIIDEIDSEDIKNDNIYKYNEYLPVIREPMVHETFQSMNLRKKLSRNLCSMHGLSPLPIQSLAFDKIMDLKNTYNISGSIIESAMGSGKTLAYLLPILNEFKPLQTGQIIIVIPSNELGVQTKAMIKSYLINSDNYKHNHRSSSYYSNNEINKKQFNLQHCVMHCNSNDSLDYNIDYIKSISPSIIIGTPKRIRELFLYSVIKASMINYIVFDEIDTLFPIKQKNMHKNKQLYKQNVNHSHLKPAQLILNGIIKQQSDSDHKCHAMFVGATISNQLKSYINQIMQPYPVQLISTYTDHNVSNAPNVSKLLSPNIMHQYICVDDCKDKAYIISDLINTIRSDPKEKKKYNPAVLIFVSKNTSPIKFAESLCGFDVKCALLHEYINDKTMRSQFLKLFRNGSIDAVVATESICRGLDFIWLDHVIVAEMPSQDITYLHIAGRCSRLESKGFVTSIVDPHEEGKLKTYCFKYQIKLNELDDKGKINKLKKQRRKYNKINTFPLLLQNTEYQKKLKKQLYLQENTDIKHEECL